MKQIFKFINQAAFTEHFMGKSKSWLTHKMKGTDSKGGFDSQELNKLADGLDNLADELKKSASSIRKESTLLINILK